MCTPVLHSSTAFLLLQHQQPPNSPQDYSGEKISHTKDQTTPTTDSSRLRVEKTESITQVVNPKGNSAQKSGDTQMVLRLRPCLLILQENKKHIHGQLIKTFLKFRLPQVPNFLQIYCLQSVDALSIFPFNFPLPISVQYFTFILAYSQLPFQLIFFSIAVFSFSPVSLLFSFLRGAWTGKHLN